MQVRLGEHSLNNTRDCDFDNYCLDPVQDIDIKEKIKHKKYSYNGKLNDIGLLKLVHPADMTKNNVNTVCLPLKPEDQIEWLKKNNEKVLKSMTITGWGKIAVMNHNLIKYSFLCDQFYVFPAGWLEK